MTPERTLLPEINPARAAGPIPLPEPTSLPRTVLQFPTLVQDKRRAPSRRLLLFEFLLLFVVLPLLLCFSLIARVVAPLYVLWAAAAYCMVLLWRDHTFDLALLWNQRPLRSQLPQMLALFAVGVVVVSVLVHLYAPHLFLILVREHPRTWDAVMLLYPVLSVYPQSLIYRAWLFHRYRPLLHQPWMMILASAAAFSFVHILFHNWIAVALTFPGGILFARRYQETRSLCVSSIEHALYGCFLFTIGLGQYFGVKPF